MPFVKGMNRALISLTVALATMVTTLASLHFCGMLALHPTTSVQHPTELKRAYLEVLSSELDVLQDLQVTDVESQSGALQSTNTVSAKANGSIHEADKPPPLLTSPVQPQPDTARARRFNSSKPIMVVHIRKTAGSSLCNAVARYNRGEWKLSAKTGDGNRNCNTDDYWYWYYSDPVSVLPQMWCDEIYRRTIAPENATAVFFEGPIHSVLPCDEFRSMIVLREPVARIVSDLLQAEVTSLEQALENFATWRGHGARPLPWIGNQARAKISADVRAEWTNRFLVDNVYIRTILGTRAYFARRSMTRSDLDQAKAALLKFDWVIFQDTLNDSLERLNKEHGWELTMPKTKERVRVNKPGKVMCCVVLRAVLCCIVLYCVALDCVVLYCAVLCYAVLRFHVLCRRLD